jgi:light-regulated signal transduction histidine kinase (bacteriophytochrome)
MNPTTSAIGENDGRRHAQLAAADQALNCVSRCISHDLRAPLRAIDGLTQILSEDYSERLGEEGRNVLQVIRDGCRRMDEYVTGLLSFAQMSTQTLDPTPIDMTALAYEAAKQVKSRHSNRACSLEILSLPSSTGDALLIRQVWYQLLDNALKYSGKRAVPTVRISGRIEGHETIYRIQDNGVGFDMHYVHKLFGIFQPLHKSEDFAGMGVGLAIAQNIVMRHGGRIWAQGVPDAGALFQFALPIAQSSTNSPVT